MKKTANLLIASAALLLGAGVVPRAAAHNLEQAPSAALAKPETVFPRLAAQLSEQRLNGADGTEKSQEQALAILDSLVLEALNQPGIPDLTALNRRLAGMVSQQPPVGEGYRVLALGGSPAVYALAANFGLAGPSAVRIYASVNQRYVLAARIDRFTQKNFFDEYMELLPVRAPGVVFVTVSGRTDELETGLFMAWQYKDGSLQSVWTSDPLQQSRYESGPEGFQVTYCAETDEENPRVCRHMARDLFVWGASGWERAARTDVPVPKR